MSRLSRLRSFWRSLRRGQIRDGGYRPHQAVNLLPKRDARTQRAIENYNRWVAWRLDNLFRDTGTPPERGSWVLSASTGTKERGARTPVTGTTVVFSSLSPPGNPLAVDYVQTVRDRVSRSIVHGGSGGSTGGSNLGRTRRDSAA